MSKGGLLDRPGSGWVPGSSRRFHMPDESIVTRWRSWAPQLLSLLRILTAFLFIQFGTAKLLAWPGAVMPGGGTVPPSTLPGIDGIIEMVAGTLLLLGLFTLSLIHI